MRRGRLCWQDQGRKYLKYKLNKKNKNQIKIIEIKQKKREKNETGEIMPAGTGEELSEEKN